MTAITIGYARCSTDRQDLAAQKAALERLGVPPERIYTDHGLTDTSRARPGLDQALAAVRAGDTLVVPKLDRLARSVPDARAIADTLVARGVRLALGASVYDPADPMGKMFFNILATFAEFEADLIRLRTREGMAVARARGKLRGKRPKLSERQQRELRRMHDTGEYSISVSVRPGFQLPTSFVRGASWVAAHTPPNGDGLVSVGTAVARGGADGARRECLDRPRDRGMPVRRRAAGPTAARAAHPDGGRDGGEHPARLPGLGRHQGGLPFLRQRPGQRGRDPRRPLPLDPRPGRRHQRPGHGAPRHDRVLLPETAARAGRPDLPGQQRQGQEGPLPHAHRLRAADARQPGGHGRGAAAGPGGREVLDEEEVQGH